MSDELPKRNANWQGIEPPTGLSELAPARGSEKPRREDVAWQLETALKELSYGNLLNVMVHSQRAAAMALEICEDRRGSPNDPR